MKLFYITLVLVVVGCSPAALFNNGVKKINKAIEKDPGLKLPGDTVTVVNTVTEVDTVDNEVIKTVTKTITNNVNDCNYDEIRTSTGRQLRYLRRTYKDSLKHSERMYKLETKRLEDSLDYVLDLNEELTKQLRNKGKSDANISKHENKSSPFLRFVGRMWWLILIIGIALGIYIGRFIPRILGGLKGYLWE